MVCESRIFVKGKGRWNTRQPLSLLDFNDMGRFMEFAAQWRVHWVK
jgi:hypothetical protein